MKAKYIYDSYINIPNRAGMSQGSFTGKVNKDRTTSVREQAKIKQFLDATLRIQNCVVLDIGANYGSYSFITLFNPACEVHGFEPNTEVHQDFSEILRLNNIPNVEVHPYGLSNREFTAGLYYPPTNIGSGRLSPKGWGEYQFKTLDSLNFKRVDVVKIDVEGHELEVLEGGKETIKRCQPKFIQIEINRGKIEEIKDYIKQTYLPNYSVTKQGDDFIFVRNE